MVTLTLSCTFQIACVSDHKPGKWNMSMSELKEKGQAVMPEEMLHQSHVVKKTWKGLTCTFDITYNGNLEELWLELDNIVNGADTWMEGSAFIVGPGQCQACLDKGEHGDVEITPKGEPKILKWDGKPVRLLPKKQNGAVEVLNGQYILPPSSNNDQNVTTKASNRDAKAKKGLVVLSGRFPGQKKKDVQARLEALGYTVGPRMTKATTMVVVHDLAAKETTKVRHAKTRGLQLCTLKSLL